MSFVPYEHFIIQSNLTNEEITAKLTDIINPSKLLHTYRFSNKNFNGHVGDSRFKIVPVIEGMSSFAPVITGTISYNRIEVTMKLHWVISTFMLLAFGISLFIQYSFLASYGFSLFSFFPVLLLISGYSLATKFFRDEAFKARTILEKMLG